MRKGFVRCKTDGCEKEADIILVSPSGKQQAGYCKKHYKKGKWIAEQNVYHNWKIVKEESTDIKN